MYEAQPLEIPFHILWLRQVCARLILSIIRFTSLRAACVKQLCGVERTGTKLQSGSHPASAIKHLSRQAAKRDGVVQKL